MAGKVVETMNATGYTYICLEKDGKRGWSAVPATTVKVGDEIEILPGTEMGQFSSKSMNRTFDNIVFSRGIKGQADQPVGLPPLTSPAKPAMPAMPAGHPPMPDKDAAKPEMPAMPAGHPPLPEKDAAKPTGAETAPAGSAGNIAGKVVETMAAAGYTYICLEKDGKKTWVAAPPMKVAVGDELVLTPGFEMKQFTSKALNRTFDSIYFTSGPVEAK
jgi:hypothetical protein